MRIWRHTTQLYRLLQQGNWSFRTTLLRLFAGLLIRLNMSDMAYVCHICILSQTCNFATGEDAKKYMTGYDDFLSAKNPAPFVRRGLSSVA